MTDANRKKVFVACRELGIKDQARREMQERVTGKSSLSEMTDPEIELVVNHLVNSGWTPSAPKHTAAPRRDVRFIHVLWSKLSDAGKLDNPTREGLNRFIRRRFGDHWGSVPADVDHLRDAEQIAEVIEALKKWCKREGVAL